MKYINQSLAKYLLAGLVNTGLTYLVYLFGLQFLPYLAAYSISYLSGIVISYLLNSIFVFKTPLHWKTALQYPLVYLVQYLIGSVLISFFVEYLAIQPSIAALFNVLILLPISFLMSRFILAKKSKKEQA